MRLIDADALTARYDEEHKGTPGRARELITEAPTIDAEPVKHGRWIIECDSFDCELMRCSICGDEFYDGDNDTVDRLLNYCPNCGAKMDG